jgi:hypothetical protein
MLVAPEFAMSKHTQQSEQVQRATPEIASDTSVGNVDRQRIAQRAYELYQARGGGHGHADEDWFAAEQELSKRPSRGQAR